MLQSCSFGFSRSFSSASKLFEKAGNGWNDGDVPDVKKWNERMDELAVQSKTDLAVIGEWADLLEEGVAAKLPDIEITLRRHRDISSNLEEYMDAVVAESEDDLNEEFDDEEFDDEDDEEYSEEEELTDEELARIIEEEGEAGEELSTEDEHKLEDVAREELANELEREQGSDEKGNKKGRKF